MSANGLVVSRKLLYCVFVAKCFFFAIVDLFFQFILQVLVLLSYLSQIRADLFELCIELHDIFIGSSFQLVIFLDEFLDFLLIFLESALHLQLHVVVHVVFILLESHSELFGLDFQCIVFFSSGAKLNAKSFDLLRSKGEAGLVFVDPSLKVIVFACKIGVVLFENGDFFVDLELVQIGLIFVLSELFLELVVFLTESADAAV